MSFFAINFEDSLFFKLTIQVPYFMFYILVSFHVVNITKYFDFSWHELLVQKSFHYVKLFDF